MSVESHMHHAHWLLATQGSSVLKSSHNVPLGGAGFGLGGGGLAAHWKPAVGDSPDASASEKHWL
jgi:hypothetical protein